MFNERRLLRLTKGHDILLHRLMDIVNIIEKDENRITNKKIVKVETNGPYIDFDVIFILKGIKKIKSYSIPFSVVYTNL